MFVICYIFYKNKQSSSLFQQLNNKKLFCLKKKPQKNFVIFDYFELKLNNHFFYKTTNNLQKYVICN